MLCLKSKFNKYLAVVFKDLLVEMLKWTEKRKTARIALYDCVIYIFTLDFKWFHYNMNEFRCHGIWCEYHIRNTRNGIQDEMSVRNGILMFLFSTITGLKIDSDCTVAVIFELTVPSLIYRKEAEIILSFGIW